MISWPHAPRRLTKGPGSYILTAATYHKQHFFDTELKLDVVLEKMFVAAEQEEWQLQAWAIFSNHYHLVAYNPNPEPNIRRLASKIHTATATDLNKLDKEIGRQVWYRCWDTALTFERSYYARLGYVIRNPVKHGLVTDPTEYRWCSAAWFQSRADHVLYQTVQSFKTDLVKVPDDF